MKVSLPINFDLRFSCLILMALFVLPFQVFSQNKIKLTSNHSDAVFSKMDDGDMSKLTLLGEGEVSFKLEKSSINKVMVAKSGFEPVYLEFPKSEKYDKE